MRQLDEKMTSREENRGRLYRQLALDFCCTEEEIRSGENQYHVYRKKEGRRRFRTDDDCFLKVMSIRNRLLFTGEESILAWCREKYGGREGAWFMEPAVMRELDRELERRGYQIDQLRPFYVALEPGHEDSAGAEIRWWRGKEIEAFRDDPRFTNAFSFCPTAPDEIGVAALRDGRITGMAGVSSDGVLLWQIGIDVLPEARGSGIGVMLVELLKNEVLRQGKIPFYGTAVSHTLSRDVAIRSGFRAGWAELTTKKI